MQVTLTPHAEQLLRTALAQHPGQSAAELLEQALAERLEREAATACLPEPRRLRADEFKAALDRLAHTGSPLPPSLSEHTFPREMIYQDHD